jgi:hypothetical protein
MSELGSFLLGFGFNLLVALVVVRFVYYPTTHNKSYVFTFLAFNTVIYLVLSFLASVVLGLGVGFGLFAIFSILRYRTDPIPIREMTYLFVIAALPVMNAAGANSALWPQLTAANLVVLALLFVLEKGWGFHYEASKQIVYEKIELIHPDRRRELLTDLEARTGLKVKRLVIGKVDFLHDTASLKIFYDDPGNGVWQRPAGLVSAAVSVSEDAGNGESANADDDD